MKLNYKKTLLVGFAFFLICAFWQAYDTIVPLMLVNKFGLNQTLSGIIMSLDNVIAVFLLPIFGTLSDKTNTKFGRRTPYIVIGTIVAALAFFGLTFADNAQLANIKASDSTTFYAELFEENANITNAEYSSIYNKTVDKEYSVRDYASEIVFNKKYAELTEEEQNGAKEWFVNINKAYNENHSEAETKYAYFGGRYYSEYEEKDGEYYALSGGDTVKIEKSSLNSAFTNLITPARSAYAWNKTISNPVPFIFFGLLLILTLLAMATFRSPAVALMPDVTIKPLRSQGNAVINLMGTIGGMIVLVFGIVFGTGKSYNQTMSYTAFIGAVCVLMVLALVAFIWGVREPKWVKEMEEDSVKYGIEDVETKEGEVKKLSKGEKTSLILILLSVALWYISYNGVISKYSLYATNVLHKDYNTTLLLAQGAAIISYIPVGYLARKIGRKKSIIAGVIMLTVAFGGATFMSSSSSAILLNLLFALAGIGWATINVNSFPMVVELASGGNVGKFTGYYYTASMAAQIITPILSGGIMDLAGSMRPLFYYATFFSALAIVTMAFVKHGDSKPTEKKTVLEEFDAGD